MMHALLNNYTAKQLNIFAPDRRAAGPADAWPRSASHPLTRLPGVGMGTPGLVRWRMVMVIMMHTLLNNYTATQLNIFAPDRRAAGPADAWPRSASRPLARLPGVGMGTPGLVRWRIVMVIVTVDGGRLPGSASCGPGRCVAEIGEPPIGKNPFVVLWASGRHDGGL